MERGSVLCVFAFAKEKRKLTDIPVIIRYCCAKRGSAPLLCKARLCGPSYNPRIRLQSNERPGSLSFSLFPEEEFCLASTFPTLKLQYLTVIN